MLKKSIEELEDLTIDELNAELFNSIDYQYLDQRYLNTLLYNGATLAGNPNNHGWTPLHWSIMGSNNIEIFKLLLNTGSDINAVNDSNRTPLQLAAYYNRLDVAKILLEVGADLNIKSIYDFTPLELAIDGGGIALVKILLAAGADPNSVYYYGRISLHLVMNLISRGEDTVAISLVKLLLTSGANKNLCDGQNKTPWDYANDNIRIQVPELHPNA